MTVRAPELDTGRLVRSVPTWDELDLPDAYVFDRWIGDSPGGETYQEYRARCAIGVEWSLIGEEYDH